MIRLARRPSWRGAATPGSLSYRSGDTLVAGFSSRLRLATGVSPFRLKEETEAVQDDDDGAAFVRDDRKQRHHDNRPERS
ncbi:MAG: hypothetical protein M3Y80_05870 [Verrucomicrobiota bacterium]|nr:hypothetical protein [Verrucomicrobiota bacterium]